MVDPVRQNFSKLLDYAQKYDTVTQIPGAQEEGGYYYNVQQTDGPDGKIFRGGNFPSKKGDDVNSGPKNKELHPFYTNMIKGEPGAEGSGFLGLFGARAPAPFKHSTFSATFDFLDRNDRSYKGDFPKSFADDDQLDIKGAKDFLDKTPDRELRQKFEDHMNLALYGSLNVVNDYHEKYSKNGNSVDLTTHDEYQQSCTDLITDMKNMGLNVDPNEAAKKEYNSTAEVDMEWLQRKATR
jgi:hypothetical protein